MKINHHFKPQHLGSQYSSTKESHSRNRYGSSCKKENMLTNLNSREKLCDNLDFKDKRAFM